MITILDNSMQVIKEGNARIKIEIAEKVSKEMKVFYNPAMKHNRDISILILGSVENKGMQIALPLEASGIRGIRFLKELGKGKIKSLSFNDYSEKAVQSIINNLKFNGINRFSIIKNRAGIKYKKIMKTHGKNDRKINIYNEDASLFLLKSAGFDYVDIDPFGTSNPFLDAAVKRISRNGILAVTNTDTAALTGTYPDACIRKYWAKAKRDYMMHETGLRILIRKVQLIGMQYEKALIPIFSYFKDHYFRIFFRCVKGKKEADRVAERHGILNEAGPLWIGNLWDAGLTNKMHTKLLKDSRETNKKITKNNSSIINNNNSPDKELLKFLKTIKEESKMNTAGFYDLHQIAEKFKLGAIPKKEDILRKINDFGYNAASTHFSGTGIRTNMAYEKLVDILKE